MYKHETWYKCSLICAEAKFWWKPSETHVLDGVSTFLENFFSENLNKLYIIWLEIQCWLNFAMKLLSGNASISRYFHFGNMKWLHIFSQIIWKNSNFICFCQYCRGLLISVHGLWIVVLFILSKFEFTIVWYFSDLVKKYFKIHKITCQIQNLN